MPEVKAFFDKGTYTLTYVVYDPKTRDGVIIDPVLNYDPQGSSISYESLDELTSFLKDSSIKLHLILETHAHADHLSSAQWLKKKFPDARLGIGEKITTVQKTFGKLLNLGPAFKTDGSQFDFLIRDEDVFKAGSLQFHGIATPGHTPACMSYIIEDCVFTGDAMFMPDYGTGRCDFPGGDAKALYHSLTKRLYTLPDRTRVFVGHDYQPGGRELKFETTIAAEKAENIHMPANKPEADFVNFRQSRDKTLQAPRLLFQSIQVNIAAGHLPPAENNDTRYLKMPLFGL